MAGACPAVAAVVAAWEHTGPGQGMPHHEPAEVQAACGSESNVRKYVRLQDCRAFQACKQPPRRCPPVLPQQAPSALPVGLLLVHQAMVQLKS